MDEPGFLSSIRVAILGLGLMGGSMAMALRGRCAGLLGVDPDPETLRLARKLQVVDLVSPDPHQLLLQADLIVLAAPVRAILSLIAALPDLHPGPAIVIDLGSTKTQICQALAQLPERFEAAGGHPMCGKEILSLANADPKIYQGATFAFTPLVRTTERARLVANELAQLLGSRPLWLNPETHDRWVAATSHLPYLVANALAGATPIGAGILAGPGYRSTTRLATTPTSMMLDILATNRINLLESLQRFREGIRDLEQSLASEDFEQLKELLDHNADLQREVIEGEFYGTQGNPR